MNTIKQTYLIAASPADVWRALTDQDLIREWSGAPASFLVEPGAEYALWNGDIRGSIVELVPNERLVQTWQPESWTRRDSVVTFTLRPHAQGTQVDLVHENVEADDYDGTDEGWDIYYLGAIKKMLEVQAPKKRPAPKKKAVAKKAAPKKKALTKKTAAKKKTDRRGSS